MVYFMILFQHWLEKAEEENKVQYQGYWKNRPSQQLFKAFIYIYLAATCFSPRWPSSGGIHNYFREVT
jgi:hypothetical protein